MSLVVKLTFGSHASRTNHGSTSTVTRDAGADDVLAVLRRGEARAVEHVQRPARSTFGPHARDHMRDPLPGAESVVADLIREQRRIGIRTPAAAEHDRVVGIEVEIEVRLEVGAPEADHAEHRPRAELGADRAAEEAARRDLRAEHDAAERQVGRMLVPGTRLAELARLLVVADPAGVRPAARAQVDVVRAGLAGGPVVGRRELEADALVLERTAALAVARLVEGERGRGGEQRGGRRGDRTLAPCARPVRRSYRTRGRSCGRGSPPRPSRSAAARGGTWSP